MAYQFINPVEKVRHEETKKQVKFDFLAHIINKMYLKLGKYLYERGYISEIADVDSLTGMYGRSFFDRWFVKVVAQAARSGEILSLVFIDVNDLKTLNDQRGHIAGDDCLKLFSEHLLESVRNSDLCFRFGGDEFVVIMWACPKIVAEKKMKNIQKLLLKQEISFSFGVAEIQEDDDPYAKLSEADAAMYEMKRRTKEK